MYVLVDVKEYKDDSEWFKKYNTRLGMFILDTSDNKIDEVSSFDVLKAANKGVKILGCDKNEYMEPSYTFCPIIKNLKRELLLSDGHYKASCGFVYILRHGNMISLTGVPITDTIRIHPDVQNIDSLDISTVKTTLIGGSKSLKRIHNFASSSNYPKVIDLSKLDCSGLEKLDLVFYDLGNLEIITFGNKKHKYKCLTSIKAICRRSGVKYIDLSAFDMSNVKDCRGAFSDCTRLEKIVMDEPHPDANIVDMFTGVDYDVLPDWYKKRYEDARCHRP